VHWDFYAQNFPEILIFLYNAIKYEIEKFDQIFQANSLAISEIDKLLRDIDKSIRGSGLRDHPNASEILDNQLNSLYDINSRYILAGDIIKKEYRKRSQLPRPDLRADADENRETERFQTRIDANVAKAALEFQQATGMSRKELVETAITKYLATQLIPNSEK